MTVLKGAEIEAFIARPDPSRPIALVYGPNAGSVSERVEALVRASVDDLADPFGLVRLEGDALVGDPACLVDEAATALLFGGRRALWVKAGGRNVAPAVQRLLGAGPGHAATRVVIEAGDLKRSAPLRLLCERARTVAVIPCYADTERDLVGLLETALHAARLAIAPDARAALLPLLGGDRRASRNEIEKLVLYAGEAGRMIDVEAVTAVVADASALALDAVVDASFAGRLAELDRELAKAIAAGTAPAVVVGAAMRHAVQLHKMRLTVDKGIPTADAVGSQVFFRRKPVLEAALKAWTAQALIDVIAALADAALAIRRDPSLAEAVAHKALQAVALAARIQAARWPAR